MLLVECFAGSHPVAKIARQINQTSSATGLRVAAYVGIELNPWKRPTPTAEDLGLSPDRWLGLYGTSGTSQRPQTGAEGSLGNVADFETQVCTIWPDVGCMTERQLKFYMQATIG